MSAADERGGGAVPPPPLALPDPLALPSPLGPPGDLPLQDPLTTPTASTPTAGHLRSTPIAGPRLRLVPTPPAQLTGRRAAPDRPPSGGAHADGGPAPAPGADRGAPRRLRRRLGGVLATALALLLAIALLAGHHDKQGPTSAPVPTAADTSVGMPVPVGNAPVHAVRIALVVRPGGLPPVERRALGAWVARTQNAATRLRIVDGTSSSTPVTGQALEDALPARGQDVATARRWLVEGARHRHQAGAILRVGGARTPLSVPSTPRLRMASVLHPAADRHVRRQLAARIARAIMVSARQSEG
jgi:hypothetical protein